LPHPVVASGQSAPLCLSVEPDKRINRRSAGAVAVFPRQEPSEAWHVSGADPGRAAAFGLTASLLTWDEFGGVAWSVHNTVVASHSQMCVQYRPSTREHSDLLLGEFGIRSRGASIRESTGQNSLAEGCRKRQRQRSRESPCRSRSIEESLNQDMRVSKPLCSRCALNVSFWGILWHSVSRFGARKVLMRKVKP
jgi:hypothetical protein